MRRWYPIALLTVTLIAMLLAACSSTAEPEPAALSGSEMQPVSTEDMEIIGGQTVYVPAYSSIFYADAQKTWDLAVTLAIRNTDANNPIIIKSARYHDADGNFILDYVPEPLELAPLGTAAIVVERSDNRGGVGANFVVKWGAESAAREPLIETVMVSAAGSQALAFTSPGRVISGDNLELHTRQSVYVPAYSDIFFNDVERTLDLAVSLVVHNTDAANPITITSMRYYDTDGNLVVEHMETPITLAPWATTSVVVEREDASGGIGANFIVDWKADRAVSAPVIESIMVSTAGSHGIGFTGSGQVISHDE